MRFARRVVLIAALAILSVQAMGNPTMTLLLVEGQGPVVAGETIAVRLTLSIPDGIEVAGYQAFVGYDESLFQLSDVQYSTNSPFSLEILSPIPTGAGTIDLAAGIDVFANEPPVTSIPVNAPLATIQFLALQDSLCVSSIHFRPHTPPTRLTDPEGEEIPSLVLLAAEGGVSPDLNGDGVVDVFDLLELLAQWGPCPLNDQCLADLDCNGVVDVFDLLFLLASWG